MILNNSFIPFHLMLSGTIVAGLSSGNMFVGWVFLEMNMFLFIMCILFKEQESSGGIQYFIIQSLGSSVMFFSISGFELEGLYACDLIFATSVIMKIGAFPFIQWYLKLLENLGWWNFFILSTLQKLLPVYVIGSVSGGELMGISVMGTCVVPCILGVGESGAKNILAISSIFNNSWILGLSKSFQIFLVYFMIYTITLYPLLLVIEKSGIFLTSHCSGESLKGGESWAVLFGLLSMGGLPPLLGFWGKVGAGFYLFGHERVLGVMMFVSSFFILVIYMNFSLIFLNYHRTISALLKKNYFYGAWPCGMVPFLGLGWVFY